HGDPVAVHLVVARQLLHHRSACDELDVDHVHTPERELELTILATVHAREALSSRAGSPGCAGEERQRPTSEPPLHARFHGSSLRCGCRDEAIRPESAPRAAVALEGMKGPSEGAHLGRTRAARGAAADAGA